MFNKLLITILLIIVGSSLLFAQADSTSSWHLLWDYPTALVDTGIVDNFIITRLNSENAEEKEVIVQKNNWTVIGSENGTSVFQEADTDLLPGVIYAYTAYAASADTLTSPPSNIAQGTVPKILAPDNLKFHIDEQTGEASGIIGFSLLNRLEENLDLSYRKDVVSPSGGDLFDEVLSTSNFTFSSDMDSGEVAYLDITATNADTSKAFFYTKRITLFFTTDSVAVRILIGVPIVSVSENAAQITWQTSTPSRDYVVYGTTHDKNLQSAEDQTAITNHERTLSGLSANTTYYFQIISQSATSGIYYSDEYQFLTAAQPGLERKSRIYPGKFIASRHSQITFYDIPAGGRLEIYSWIGSLVYEKKNMAGGEFSWLVQNPSGKNISSGFYLYYIKDQRGRVEAQGKFIVIR
jgi:hypothetical protein